jgi:hypothetical protein
MYIGNASADRTGAIIVPAEIYIPLWYYSSSYATGNSSTYNRLKKGATGINTTNLSDTNLFTNNWANETKFALEINMHIADSALTAWVTVWDITANAQIVASEMSTNSTNTVRMRSGTFTLTKGNVYGVAIKCTGGTATISVTNASLVVIR